MKKRSTGKTVGIIIILLIVGIVSNILFYGVLSVAYVTYREVSIDNTQDKVEVETETGEEVETEETEETETTDEIYVRDKVKQTIMVYLIGSTLETDYGMATEDIQEMIDSDFDTENCNVILFTGGADYWWNYGISEDNNEIYLVTDDGISLIKSEDSQNMGEADTLTEFMDFTYEYFPADNYGMIFWDHGGGSIVGFGYDEVYDGDGLTLDEMKSAFDNSKIIAAGTKLEWIGFDACLMGTLETAYSLSPYADYLIASEETSPGYGWDYSMLSDVSQLSECDGATVGQLIIDDYFKFYEENSDGVYDLTLSCLDLSKAQNVVDLLSSYIETIDASLLNGNYYSIALSRENTKTYGVTSVGSLYDLVDLKDFVDNISDESSAEAESLLAGIDEFVTYENSSSSESNGVSIYFPFDNSEYAKEWVQYYETFNMGSYYTFISDFTATLCGDVIYQWSGSDTASQSTDEEQSTEASNDANNGTGEANQGNNSYGEGLTYQLTAAQAANVVSSKLVVCQPSQENENYYYTYLQDRCTSIDANGLVTANFSYKQYFLSDDDESYQCEMIEVERTDEYIEYAIPAAYYDVDGSRGEAVYVYIKVDDVHPLGIVMGLCSMSEVEDNFMSGRHLFEPAQGSALEILILEEDYEPDGGLNVIHTDRMTIDGELKIKVKDYTNINEYMYFFVFKDSQGHSHYTQPKYFE